MTKDEFVAIASESVEVHFPKGLAKHRGEAMVLVADLTRELVNAGLLVDRDEESISDKGLLKLAEQNYKVDSGEGDIRSLAASQLVIARNSIPVQVEHRKINAEIKP